MQASPTFLLALSSATLWAASAAAQATDAVSFTQPSPTAIRLRIDHAVPRAGRVQVVRLSTGQTLFTDTYMAPAYGHRFDFDQAPNGRYLVRLQSGTNQHRCIVQVRTRAFTSTARVASVRSRAMAKSVVVGNLQARYVQLAAPDTSTATSVVSQGEMPRALR